ncbi:hypothetical protein EBH_0031660 [Eimeria brunetti]|uniref:Uncharacterized protein n=1 Tax=Eimeria brunetti TaxID=51314 RepID=U6LJ50_9EIME|nr:hypothetical protein EBH_0031660 [Eimeria brunetti]
MGAAAAVATAAAATAPTAAEATATAAATTATKAAAAAMGDFKQADTFLPSFSFSPLPLCPPYLPHKGIAIEELEP